MGTDFEWKCGMILWSSSDQFSFVLLTDHINYVKNLIGVDYIGIGSDYDGIDR